MESNPLISVTDKIILCSIIVSAPVEKELCYEDIGLSVRVGDIVEIGFGSRKNVIIGVCTNIETVLRDEVLSKFNIPPEKIKPIISIVQSSVFKLSTLNFFRRFSEYYMILPHIALSMILPSVLIGETNKLFHSIVFPADNAIDIINNSIKTKLAKIKTIKVLESAVFSNKFGICGYDLVKRFGLTVVKNLIKKGVLKTTHLDLTQQKQIPSFFGDVDKNDEIKFSISDTTDIPESGDVFVTDYYHGKKPNYPSPIEIQLPIKDVVPTETIIDNSTFENIFGSLNKDQFFAYQTISGNYSNYKTTLLYGVTGSGKTEVYIAIIKDLLIKDPLAQILIMVPEITMASSAIHMFQERFSSYKTVIWHSSVSESQKLDEMYNITSGRTNIIVGARSAILLPYANLRFIVVDEEHDTSYKQDETPVYNARDTAILRGVSENCQVLLCSATPSMESYKNAIDGKYSLITIKNRFGGNFMPSVSVVDTCSSTMCSDQIFSEISIQKISRIMKMGFQSLVFLNRRGYSRMLACKMCRSVYECPNCDNRLVYHKVKGLLKCHYCLHSISMPKSCIACGKDMEPMKMGGYGVENVSEKLKSLFPDSSVITMSSDTIGNEVSVQEMIRQITDSEVDIIVGTQIASKGYNFEKLKLVVALNVDVDFISGDTRIFEKTYQLLTQVAGRSGRFGNTGGEMIIQTKNPSNPVIQSMVSGIEDHFYKEEIRRRESGNLPPFTKQIAIIAASDNRDDANNHINKIATIMHSESMSCNSQITVFGPAENTIHRLKRKYRFHILIQSKSYSLMKSLLMKHIMPIIKSNSKVFTKIDVNPSSMI